MNKKAEILFFLFVIFGSVSFSQNNFSLFGFSKPSFTLSNIGTNKIQVIQKMPPISFLNTPQFSFGQNNNLHYFHYEIPKGAVFCRMENNLRNTFHIWIKVRAGTDESYSEIKPQ